MSHQKYAEVIKTLHECMEACNHCYTSCFEEDANNMKACIRLDRDCATICASFEQALTYDTAFVQEYAQLCATACKACGEECAKHEPDHCKKCAEACFECEDACKKLIA